ncbi:MAG: hypothetical protein ABIF92_00655, partial [archaeon]
MKRSLLVATMFLFTMLALAGAVHAASTINSRTTIEIKEPKADDVVFLTGSANKKESLVNFTYTASSENNISWCRLILNGTQKGLDLSIDRGREQYFKDIGMNNGTWWYYIQCRDNFSVVYNSTNRTVIIRSDDRSPTITPKEALTEFNTTTGQTFFKFIAIDDESGMDNCTLVVDGETMGQTERIGNNTIAAFPKIFLTDGDYTWYVKCRDRAGNTGTSQHAVFVAERSTMQTITLISPKENAVDMDGYVTFKFVPVSTRPIMWCVLKLNETFNASSNEIVNNSENSFDNLYIDHGPYNWSVACTDAEDYSVNSTRWDLIVNRTILASQYLKVEALTPEDYFFSEEETVNFTYVATSAQILTRCELITNGSIRETNSHPINGQEAEFLGIDFSEGVWEWR